MDPQRGSAACRADHPIGLTQKGLVFLKSPDVADEAERWV